MTHVRVKIIVSQGRKRYSAQCPECGLVEPIGAWAVAHLSHTITRDCPCGATYTIGRKP